ncbi:PDR/VanB family oxidoreductase [Paralimibaculum aggregatum]|uniref:PDR/VanB family oxidoreductase n=1 Tax=Paralimibaculum aggregatum TaxID=3036245 RepID=A0ABQ6LJY9_9RHOB|nr:PDR/VanB family oxidoreductase [Limibaculum sp. NKW23]GMG82736.1 PDR/VanB family oxidoreductase [Limibaculum sp. NKW23]
MPIDLEIRSIADETPSIRRFELVCPRGGTLPPFTAGAHLAMRLGNGLVRRYSLASDPAERGRYWIAVQREAQGRGGSAWIFENWRTGDRVTAAAPENGFPLAPDARRHLLIAGGIGITPILSMAQALARTGAEYALHYCTRSPEGTAFRELLARPPHAGRVHCVHDGGDPGRGLDLRALLARPAAGTHVYVCGPRGLIGAVREAAAHWPAGSVHFEYFAAADTGAPGERGDTPFTVAIAGSGAEFAVPAGRTILSVLAENGIAVPSLCEEGVCGACLTRVAEGVPDHRDGYQTDAEKARNDFVALCCSRARTPRLVLDL